MTASPSIRFLRLCCVALAIVLALPAAPFVAGTARAQEAGERSSGGGVLRFLFQRRDTRRQDRAPPQAQQPRRTTTVRRSQPSLAATPATPATPAVEKAEDAKRVLVIGDFLAGGLADGLASAFEDNANVLVVDRSNGSSGLVRDDYYDWPGQIGSVLDAENPTVVVIMIGSNDRQQMRVEGTRQQPRTEEWIAEYERRVTALAKAVRDRQLPLVWVGNLPFKPSTMSSDMIAFNDIYRRIVDDAGGEFIDVWDGFVDETGAFVENGPDMNGQPAQLRASDGINVTRQGRRKIAFYVEKPLNRLLGLLEGGGVARLPDQLQGPSLEGTGEIDRTAPVAIDDYALDGGAELLGAPATPRKREMRTPAERLARDGVAPNSQPGRADDFVVRKAAPAEAAGSGETTSATR